VIKINMRAIRYFSKEIVTITFLLIFLFSFLKTTNMSVFTMKVETYQRNEKTMSQSKEIKSVYTERVWKPFIA
jgi:hypothetical protein